MNRPIDAAPGFGFSPVPPADGPVDKVDSRTPRVQITELVEKMLIYRANPGVTNAFFRISFFEPQDLITRFRKEASLKLLVPDGKKMPQPLRDDTERLADSSKLTGVVITADRAKEGIYRRRKIAVEFLFGYKEGDRTTKASQALVLEDDSKEPVRITIRKSAATDLDSEEAGYDPGRAIPISDEQATGFLGILEELFEVWKKSPEGIDRAKRKHVASHLSKTS